MWMVGDGDREVDVNIVVGEGWKSSVDVLMEWAWF